MNNWTGEIKKVETEKERGRTEVTLAMIAANNHYGRFWTGNCQSVQKDGWSFGIILDRPTTLAKDTTTTTTR